MTWSVLALILAVVALLVLAAMVAWLSRTATRLDQLHHRIELARESMRTQLLLRSGWTLEVAASGALDGPESLLLAEVARAARAADEQTFERVESDLSGTLRAVFADPATVAGLGQDDQGREVAGQLSAACRKVQLARRFHNEQVASARSLRSLRRVRLFRLTGHAGPLATIDLDDVPPGGLDQN